MKEVVIISGKGGTGKTTLTGSLAALLRNGVIADCDVDAADLHLLLNPSVKVKTDFYSGVIPEIDTDLCTQCGKCVQACEFDAISPDIKIDRTSCEGCAVCFYVCPVKAVKLNERLCGEWYSSETRFGPLIHARLGIAEENSGKLVTLIKKESKALAEKLELDLILVDGSPGIGCPVISSLSGANLALIVTEPTVSGVHDMDRILKLTGHFGIKSVVVINKADLNRDMNRKIESAVEKCGVSIIGRIPYDPVVTQAMVKGKTVIESSDGSVTQEIKKIAEKLVTILDLEE